MMELAWWTASPWWVWALLCPLPAGVLAMTILNLATWPRGRAGGEDHRFDGRISVLIPARNEADNLARCVQAILAGSVGVDEVLVYDDHSTDGTAEILADLSDQFPRVRRVEPSALPPGWVGKPHACHRLARAAGGDLLVFVDADTFLTDDGLARLSGLIDARDADIVTAVPRQTVGGMVERLIVPLLHLTYTSWFPLMLVSTSSDTRFLAANGQLLAVRRGAYDAIGGFEAVRADVVDDMAFCRRAKLAGRRVVFADGFRMATCRMYRTAAQVWDGFSKNLYEGIGAQPVALAGVFGAYMGAFVLPYVVAVAAWVGGYDWLFGPALVGVTANLAVRILLAWRFRQPPEGVLVHPVSVVGLLAIAVNSWRWHLGDAIAWSGRTYAKKSQRHTEPRA